MHAAARASAERNKETLFCLTNGGASVKDGRASSAPLTCMFGEKNPTKDVRKDEEVDQENVCRSGRCFQDFCRKKKRFLSRAMMQSEAIHQKGEN